MAASLQDIQLWLKEAKPEHTHMIVVCDRFDWEDYPVYVSRDQDAASVVDIYDGRNMQEVMEVYDLRLDIDAQLAEHRAWHL